MLIAPHGDRLVNRILDSEERAKTMERAEGFPKISLDEENVKDVKNIARGVYSPLEGFLCKADFDSMVSHMRLANGTIWPIPTVLDTTKEEAAG